MNADRNLLFGILALQLDFITRDALVAAMNAWLLRKAAPLGDILIEEQVLSVERRQLLEALVNEHLKQHGNQPEKSLAALTVLGSVREELAQLRDPDLEGTLAHISTNYSADLPVTRNRTATEGSRRFRIIRPHARGGLGEVYVAQDKELRRDVALKQIQARHADDPDSRSRFVLEAEITGGLEHPGIVPVYGLGTYADGRPFYAMRFIKGDSFRVAIARFHSPRCATTPDAAGATETVSTSDGDESPSPHRQNRTKGAFAGMEFRRLLGRFIDVCNAIQYAHSRGVLHRDLKPGNIMLGKYGETLVVDWGLAKLVGRPEDHTSLDELTLRPGSARKGK